MRAVDLVALRRQGGSAVLTFKERVDELSRLSAGRAEDEALLQQLVEKLPVLTVDSASRLMEEVRLRDEWRQERCEQALRGLPGASEDAAHVDRMRDYVALLAPKGSTAAQPWQRELLRQQQALAKVLQLCPGGSGERLRQALSAFMQHSQERLTERLNALEALLEHHEGPTGSPVRRAAWGEAAPSSPEHPQAIAAAASFAPPPPPATGGGSSWAMTPEAFLEQMQRQNDAVRSLQARG